jgi:toxin CptA
LPHRLARALATRVWSPRAATTADRHHVLDHCLLVVGAWAYTDVLAELARGMADNLAQDALLVALFAGAMLGGLPPGGFAARGSRSRSSRKCFAAAC